MMKSKRHKHYNQSFVKKLNDLIEVAASEWVIETQMALGLTFGSVYQKVVLAGDSALTMQKEENLLSNQ